MEQCDGGDGGRAGKERETDNSGEGVDEHHRILGSVGRVPRVPVPLVETVELHRSRRSGPAIACDSRQRLRSATSEIKIKGQGRGGRESREG
eukprot:3713075-Rhodomonas_salina.1